MTSADTQRPGAPLKLGWFSTGRGSGSRGLLTAALDAIDSGALNAQIEFVFVNRERGQHKGTDRYMDLVEGRGIPLVTLSSQRFRTDNGRAPWSELRGKFDEAVLELLEPYSVDVSVTAGYMLIAPVLCQHFIMVNLHPALPGGPIGNGNDPGSINDPTQPNAPATALTRNDLSGGCVCAGGKTRQSLGVYALLLSVGFLLLRRRRAR